jgi:hypothetical protein
MSESRLYAYGVVDADESVAFDLDDEGVEGATSVESVSHRTLAAVVTDVDELEPEESDANTRAHDDVLQEVLTHEGGRAVVPMQFGMVFENARSLKGVLRGARPAFTRALRHVEGQYELGVKLVVDDADVDREGVREAVSDRLTAVATEESPNDLFSDRLVFNRSYLVDRDAREQFDAAVDEIESRYDDDLLVRYTGPWAPYSFVDIEIGAER